MNALARKLGVTPSSLYKHVTGRDEIIELVRGRLAAMYEVGPVGSWSDAVEAHLRVERRMYTEHPNVVPLIATLTITDDTVITRIDDLSTTLLEAGFADDDVLAGGPHGRERSDRAFEIGLQRLIVTVQTMLP